MAENPYRALPSIDDLAAEFSDSTLRGQALTSWLQAELSELRRRIAAGEAFDRGEISRLTAQRLEALGQRRLDPVINATGVVLHTNLGRAPVSAATAAAMQRAAAGYVGLELDPRSGQRGGRMSEVSSLMRVASGSAATLVVNNNAAAVLLTLAALAADRGVIVSRGEAVEIGGGFRIPDVLRQSGARLIEVGTTNRTYPSDYESAVDAGTALFLKVHASNFTIDGFASTTSISELAPVSRRTDIPIVEDLGSGNLLDVTRFGLAREPSIRESIAAGATVVTASGDKLLGGPQAGIITGRKDVIERIERHPLARALRADKTCLAGVAETLRHYVRDEATSEIPIWRMIATPIEALHSRAAALVVALSDLEGAASILDTNSTIGGGSLPGQMQPSVAIALDTLSADALARELRTGKPAVYGRISDDLVLLDLRTVLPEDDGRLVQAIRSALSRVGSRPA